MKRSRWASLLLAATAVLFGQRADASRTPLTDVRSAITQPHQITAPSAAEMTADAPNQVRDASTWLVESITPLGHTDNGQPLVLISLLVPLSSLAENTPPSTRAGPYAAPETHTRVFYIGQPPLGLSWAMRTQDDGSVVAYNASGFFIPKYEGALALGSFVEGPEYEYFTSRGSVATTRDRSVVFDHGGSRYKMSYSAVSAALRNIPDELTERLIAANAGDRASMLYGFLTQGATASGSTKAKIAGSLDTAFSIFAGSTAFGNPMMNSHGNGGLFQELLGVDSRDPTYLGITKHIETGTQIGATVMVMGGAYTARGPSERSSTTRVTSWAEGGVKPDLKPGRWVVKGEANIFNFLRTGLWSPKVNLKTLSVELPKGPFIPITRDVPTSTVESALKSSPDPFVVRTGQWLFGQYRIGGGE